MSYCVKCGVELGENETKCPLCNTPIYDPENKNSLPNKDKQFSVNRSDRATIRYIKNRYTTITAFCLFMVMLVLAIINLSVNGGINWSAIPILSLGFLWFCMVFPVKNAGKINAVIICDICVILGAVLILLFNIITGFKLWSVVVLVSALFTCFCVTLPILSNLKIKNILTLCGGLAIIYFFIIDLLTNFNGWSFYIFGGIVLAWSFTLLPLYINKNYNVIGAMVLNTILMSSYIYFVMSSAGFSKQFFAFVLPLILTASLPVMIIYLINKRFKFSAFGIVSLCFLFCCIASLFIDRLIIINILMDNILFHKWSIITSVCSLLISIFLFFIEKNHNLKSFLEKKLNI